MENRPPRSKNSLISICFASIVLTACNASEPEVVVQYQYDALGRLDWVEDKVNGNRDYDYDKVGNRIRLATNTSSDSDNNPFTGSLPAPTGTRASQFADCVWKASWDPVPGAVKYKVKDTHGYNHYTESTFVDDIQCLAGMPNSNKPVSVQACNANNLCGIVAPF